MKNHSIGLKENSVEIPELSNMVEDKKQKIGLALSGGGYRAAAFHLGVFRKLEELHILEKVDVISTISGGSIIGVFYALHKANFTEFDDLFTERLQKSCIRRILYHWRFWAVVILVCLIAWLLAYDPLNLDLPKWFVFFTTVVLLISPYFIQFRLLSFTALKIKAYKAIFFGKNTLSNLPDKPVIAINATNLSTGTLWTFSKNKCSDSSYEFPRDGGKSIKFDCSKMPLAVAVASSTSVPVPFDPITIPIQYFVCKADYTRAKPKLIDGGLYDNQGIHKITQANSSYACNIIIVSDGSQPFGAVYRATSTFNILYRGIDVMMRKIKSLQFIRDVYSGQREIAYFSLDWRYRTSVYHFITSFKSGQLPQNILDHHKLTAADMSRTNQDLADAICSQINFSEIIDNGLSDEEIIEVSKIGTDLIALKEKQIKLLSKHGAALCDLQIRLYCPSLK